MSGKNITAAVGLRGTNMPADVATVQYLLNCVPVSHGGPARELDIDGFAGVITIQAIKGFQEAQFGWSDGRVDTARASGVTIVELNKYDPMPFLVPVVMQSTARRYLAKGALKGKKHSGGRPMTASEIAELRRFVPPTFRPPGKAELRGKKHSGVL
jgi:hypothetical protein